jgi:DNA repair protein RecO (recombination protein O)
VAVPPDSPLALVWRRSDFSESSRLVTLITREDGKLSTLAKGAHRATSPFLGRLDLLNLVRPRLARRPGGGLRLLRDVELVHEHRGLRAPGRFLAASYLCEIFDVAFLDGRADPPLFDLLTGALRVAERCPQRAIPTVLSGIELRFLAVLGSLPDLRRCSACGRPADDLGLGAFGLGLLCATHRDDSAAVVPTETLSWLRRLQETPGRSWDALPPPGPAARSILGGWIAATLERAPRWRRLAFPRTAPESRPSRGTNRAESTR